MSWCEPKKAKEPRGDVIVTVTLAQFFYVVALALLIGLGAGLAR